MLALNQIHHMDCLAFLEQVGDRAVDLAIVDPPYNLKKAHWDNFRDEGEFYKFTFTWLDRLIPKLKIGGSLYVFNTPLHSAYILCHLLERGLKFQNWITWDKRDGLCGAKRRYNSGQETILFLTKGDSHPFNYDEIRLPYESSERIVHARKKGILKNGKRWFPNPNGKLCGDVWHFSSARHACKVNGKLQKMPHVTPKPIEIVERMIAASSNEGGVVLDCFVGSGTTAVAAKKLGRNFLCCDAEKEYVELARENLKGVEGVLTNE